MSSDVTKRLNSVSANPTDDFLVGGGDMGDRTRSFDWSRTSLGPIAGWPPSLKTAVSIVLGCQYPLLIWWGDELLHFYNDGYVPVLGQRHPQALGQPAPQVWSEAWPIVGPQVREVMERGHSYFNEETLVTMTRNGYQEEVYMTFSFGPIRDHDGGVGGVFCACTEETQRVVDRRRLRTLRSLAERSFQARTAADACTIALATLGDNAHDLPFVLLYLIDANGQRAELAGLSGLQRGSPAVPDAIDVTSPGAPWPLRQVMETEKAIAVDGLSQRFGPLPGGPWPEPTERAMVLPIIQSGHHRVAGFVVAGISPRLQLDDAYRGFLELVAGQVATTIASARGFEEERRRAEALAELDRAKIAFFSNVSHEFRTPLTLMLGPMEDGLSDRGQPLPPRQRERQELIHRNALRLLRLVNTLLDFSRIEAGRVQASFEPIDLSRYTADLASTFRSAIERAKMQLVADCPPLSQPVFVDRDMWEKIVLNLLSNAFKHTFTGSITVSLREVAGQAELRVIDTGIGIPADQIPRLFERFHRVQGADARTHEGSGIGLTLAQELVKLHGGRIQVESQIDRGSTFLVSIPLGSSHLPAEQTSATRSRASTAVGANAFVEEALSWLPEGSTAGHRSEVSPASTCEHFDRNVVDDQPDGEADRTVRILLADDNADMRRYVGGILNRRWAVDAVADGAAALEAARTHAPDLILSDVMMPKLDGFGLLRELRADPALRHTPVILLSARAGEEASIEGLEAGADDYLIKPFSAQELIARVAAHLGMARMRRESAQRERALSDAALATDRRAAQILESINVGFCTLDSEWRYTSINPAAHRMVPILADALGKSLFDIFPEVRGTSVEENLHHCVRDQTLIEFEFYYEPQGRWYQNRYFGIPGHGVAIVWTDITERNRSEQLLRYRTAQFETLVNQAPLGVYLVDADFRIREVNPIAMPVSAILPMASSAAISTRSSTSFGKRSTEMRSCGSSAIPWKPANRM